MSIVVRKTLPIIALVAMLGSLGLVQQASADFSSTTVWMSITNTKSGTVKELTWDLPKYRFQDKVLIQLDGLTIRKINQIFNTNTFNFNTYIGAYEAEWYHFNVVIGMNRHIGSSLHLVFAKPDVDREYYIQRNYVIVNLAKPSSDQISTDFKESTNARILLSSDKDVYMVRERALILITLLDEQGELIDPDIMTVNFNVFKLSYPLEKNHIGSYVLVTPPLGRGINQITVLADKEGYNIEPNSIKIEVLPKVSTLWP